MYRINYLSSCRNIHQIYPHSSGNFLYLGDYSAAMDVNMLKSKNIKAVLTTAAGLPLRYSPEQINHRVYMALDMPFYNISKHFEDSYQFIEKQIQKGNVFVHCAAGISRSATIVIAYLMKKNNWSFSKALTFVRSKRKIICPNHGFESQLHTFEQKLSKDKLNINQNGQTKQKNSFIKSPQYKSNSLVKKNEKVSQNKVRNNTINKNILKLSDNFVTPKKLATFYLK